MAYSSEKKIEHLALSGFVVADVEYQKLIAEKHRSNLTIKPLIYSVRAG